MIYLILSCSEQIRLKSHSLFFIDIESENVATAIDINTCVKCQGNLEDKKLYIIKDGITKLIEYSKRLGNNHLTSLLNEDRDTGLIKIHRDCRKDVYSALKRKSTEPICTLRECKPAQRESINFNWKRDCFYSVEECKVDAHNPNRID